MSLDVAANEYGLIRVLRLSGALHHALEQSDGFEPLEKALAVIIAAPEDVQIVASASLRGLGLAPFLAMGYGVAADDLAAAPGLQDATEDSYVIIRSGAFGGAAVTLTQSADAQLVATLAEEGAPTPPLTALTSESAKGILTEPAAKPAKSDARIGGMVATVALLVLFALAGLMIWVAG